MALYDEIVKKKQPLHSIIEVIILRKMVLNENSHMR